MVKTALPPFGALKLFSEYIEIIIGTTKSVKTALPPFGALKQDAQ